MTPVFARGLCGLRHRRAIARPRDDVQLRSLVHGVQNLRGAVHCDDHRHGCHHDAGPMGDQRLRHSDEEHGPCPRHVNQNLNRHDVERGHDHQNLDEVHDHGHRLVDLHSHDEVHDHDRHHETHRENHCGCHRDELDGLRIHGAVHDHQLVDLRTHDGVHDQHSADDHHWGDHQNHGALHDHQ